MTMNKPIDGARGNSIAGGDGKEGGLSYFHSCVQLFISLFQDSVKLQIKTQSPNALEVCKTIRIHVLLRHDLIL